MDKITSIKLKETTKQKLAKRGEKGDSFDEIVIKLLEERK